MSITSTLLTVGPLQVQIEADDPALHQLFRSAYPAFTGRATSAPYTLTAHLDYAPGASATAYPMPSEFQAGVLYFTAPDHTGYVDVAAGRAQLTYTDSQRYTTANYFASILIALLAFEAGGLLFHGAGLLRGERGYVFFGPSGTGKTTVSRVSTEAVVLNDDLVVLLPQAGAWLVQATPFTNPTQVPPAGDRHGPLSAFYRLVQSRRVFTEPFSPAVAVAEIIGGCRIVSGDPDRAVALLARVERLVRAVPVYRLHFLPDASFWQIIDPPRQQPANFALP